MVRKTCTPEQIINKLREAEMICESEGNPLVLGEDRSCCSAGISYFFSKRSPGMLPCWLNT